MPYCENVTRRRASRVFALVDGRKNTTSASCTVSRPSWAQVYSSGMQQPNAACTRAPPQCRSCPCASCIWLLHPAPIARLVPKMVLTLRNLRWCFSFHQQAQILHLHSWWSSQLALVVFFLRVLAHLLMCILQLALCGGACGFISNK